MADHWQSRMWQGLMQWVEDEQYVERRRIVAEQSRIQISDLLAEDRLDELTLDDFNEYVWKHGTVFDQDEQEVGNIHQYSPDELREWIESGEWTVTGQQTVGGGAGVYYPPFKGTDEEKLELLRTTLRELLYSSDDLYANFERVLGEPNFFSDNWATMILCMMHPDEMGIMNQRSRAGLSKLAWLLGTEEEWGERIDGDYREFTTLLQEVRDAPNSALPDLLAVDAFLNRITDLDEPQHWKVALGIGSDDHEALVRAAGEEGFAAIGWGPDEEDDDRFGSIDRFREVQPGDYVVMHVRGGIGGVGRVTMPYYEIDRDQADNLDAHWYRRIDVDWLLGERKYGDELPGAKQRLTVIDIHGDTFWRLAAKYADDPRFEKVLGPPPDRSPEDGEDDFVGAAQQHLPECTCEEIRPGWFRVSGPNGSVTVRERHCRRADDAERWTWRFRESSLGDADFHALHGLSAEADYPEFWLVLPTDVIREHLDGFYELRDGARQLDVSVSNGRLRAPDVAGLEALQDHENAFHLIGEAIGVEASPPARAWIFQCNPDRWDLLAALDQPMPYREYWAVNQHRDEMRIGDRVYLWKAGQDAGIYGVSHVISEPYERPGDVFGTWKVDLLVERVPEEPLLREDLRSDERTAGMRIVTNPQGTNFPVTPAEDAAILEMLGHAEQRFFVLVSGPDTHEFQETGEGYEYSHRAAGRPEELTAALVAEDRQVNYLMYHTGPRYEFSSFGEVLSVDPPQGATRDQTAHLELANVRFEPPVSVKSPGAETWMERTHFLAGGLKFFSTNSVAPISALDHYTVVGAGFERDALVPTLESTARTCCCEPAFIEEIVAQLRRKGQVILYGPPGTGKTYVARRIAEYLTEGDDSRRELIQFHPSYTYEDFMEGIKPESRPCADDRWEVSYPVRPGSFMRFCERARDDEDGDRRYVFIIDEINRGQIAKVFGELMYLLEYRDDDIQLAYTKSEGDADVPERFSIPANVLIIGTMNTADRSIALVDFALRRRFTFIPFFPDDRADRGHVQGMLRRWLIREGKDQQAWVAEMLDALNRRLEPDVGRDFLIGHSYFMHEDLSEETVRETWRFQIEPLLREYFVGQQSRLDGYRLDELIAGAKGVEQPEGDAESDEADVVAEEPGDDEP